MTLNQARFQSSKPTSVLSQVGQFLAKLLMVLAITLGFGWFGPGWWQQLSGWMEAQGGWPSGQNSALVAEVSKQSQAWSQWVAKWPAQWPVGAKTQEWFQGLNATPVAGQSGVSSQDGAGAAGSSGASGANGQSGQTGNQPVAAPTPVPYTPPVDENLPQGKWLVIPKIGVRSELQKNADYETALDRGLWQVPDYGDPGSLDLPMIVAGHRFGWDWWWKTDYWKYHSFYKLPELGIGDRVEVISDQRKWIYEIYAAEEGTEISDYSGDLILYTCKHLKSPIRYFRYARLVDPTADSQKK